MNKLFRSAIAAALLIAMGVSACAETVIATDKIKVYKEADRSSKSMTVSAGTKMEKTAEKGGWYRVEKDGMTAYVPADKVEVVKEYGGEKGFAAEDTPLYKSYGSSKKICTLPEGAQVKVYSVAGDWAYVKYDGEKGYVRLKDIGKKAPEKEEAKPEEDKKDDGATDLGGATGYCREGAKVYKEASVDSKVTAKMELNDTVRMLSAKDGWVRVEKGGKKAYMKKEDLSTEKLQKEEKVKEMDWWTSDIQSIFARGVTATITDVRTGISWREIRKGGTNHADTQPCTAEDTAKLKQVYGGKWSWDRRAIWVTINGKTYAASMNGMPHGGDSVANNNFDGHHCVHFTNSRTHTGNRLDADHQAMVKVAYKAGN